MPTLPDERQGAMFRMILDPTERVAGHDHCGDGSLRD